MPGIDGFALNLSKSHDIVGHRTFVLFTSLNSTARTLLEKQIPAQILNKLRAFYGTENSSQSSHQPATEVHIK